MSKSPLCPECGHEMELADYLETEEGHASDYICMNEKCPGVKTDKD
ncbi:hypothetical protein NYE69_12750 [Paenibacillus sp. FSL R5-0527]|nr:hypothetical protein J1TS5_10290 [Paenibacillus macerans]